MSTNQTRVGWTVLIGVMLAACVYACVLRVRVLHTHQVYITQPAPESNTYTAMGREYSGDHLLRQVETTYMQHGEVHGSYFLFVGGMEGTSQTQITVSFAWLGNDGAYRYTTLPLDKIRMIPNANIHQPFVKFHWHRGDYASDSDILYAVIGVNPEDWPEKINMPIEGKTSR